MLEFIRENYTLLNDSPLLIAAIVGVFCYKKYKYLEVKYFIYFLVYVFFVDFLGGYPKFIRDYEFLGGLKALIDGTVFEQNYWWFTLFWSVGSILFITFYYQKLLKNKKNIAVVRCAGILFGVISISYIIFNWSTYFSSGFPFIKIYGAFTVLLCVTLYFLELLGGNIILSFYKSINFYISGALLIWWLVTTPVVFFDIYLTKVDRSYQITKALIFLSCNIFMYLTFAFALMFCKPKKVLKI